MYCGNGKHSNPEPDIIESYLRVLFEGDDESRVDRQPVLLLLEGFNDGWLKRQCWKSLPARSQPGVCGHPRLRPPNRQIITFRRVSMSRYRRFASVVSHELTGGPRDGNGVDRFLVVPRQPVVWRFRDEIGVVTDGEFRKSRGVFVGRLETLNVNA